MDCFVASLLAMTTEWLFENRIHPCRPGQASSCERDPGPITTAARWSEDRRPLSSNDRSRGMGPRVREDDSADYPLRLAAAVAASTTLSTSSRQPRISIASTG